LVTNRNQLKMLSADGLFYKADSADMKTNYKLKSTELLRFQFPCSFNRGRGFLKLQRYPAPIKTGGKTFYSPMPGSTFGFKIGL